MADVELLPLPSEVRLAIRAYARACVEANLAPLQAEIERLREEVEGWKEQHARDSAELRRICQHRDEYKARAERLAKALRELVDLKDNVKHSFPNDYTARKPLAWDKARALLRDQEEGE